MYLEAEGWGHEQGNEWGEEAHWRDGSVHWGYVGLALTWELKEPIWVSYQTCFND